jgi:hypothetical protein
VLYACEAISPFHLERDVLYRDTGFLTLEVGMRFGIIEEFGHPSMHPSLPVHVDDGEDCLLLAVDVPCERRLGVCEFLGACRLTNELFVDFSFIFPSI